MSGQLVVSPGSSAKRPGTTDERSGAGLAHQFSYQLLGLASRSPPGQPGSGHRTVRWLDTARSSRQPLHRPGERGAVHHRTSRRTLGCRSSGPRAGMDWRHLAGVAGQAGQPGHMRCSGRAWPRSRTSSSAGWCSRGDHQRDCYRRPMTPQAVNTVMRCHTVHSRLTDFGSDRG